MSVLFYSSVGLVTGNSVTDWRKLDTHEKSKTLFFFETGREQQGHGESNNDNPYYPMQVYFKMRAHEPLALILVSSRSCTCVVADAV